MRDRFAFLSGNLLKILACAFMLCDHIGLVLFPNASILRIIGRLAFPLFAFMIAEGCRYTRNKLRYFLTVGLFGAVCQAALYIFDKEMGLNDVNVFVTFTFSIIMVYALQAFYEKLFDSVASVYSKILYGAVFIATISAVYYISLFVNFDYNFYGALLPVYASLFVFPKNCGNNILKKLDNKYVHILTFGIGLFIMVMAEESKMKRFALLALVLLLMYSEKRGKLKLKYFFYIFYPLHLVIIEGIYYLVSA